MSGHVSGNQAASVKYVYELPYTERKMLCNILDMDNQWEKLGGQFMKFRVHELYEMRRVEKCGESPCDRLLQIWGHQNNTIASLYSLLYRMSHYQAMRVLLPFIPSKYHNLALQGEQSLTAALPKTAVNRSNTAQLQSLEHGHGVNTRGRAAAVTGGQSSSSGVAWQSSVGQPAAEAAGLPKPPQHLVTPTRRLHTQANDGSEPPVSCSALPALSALGACSPHGGGRDTDLSYQHNLNIAAAQPGPAAAPALHRTKVPPELLLPATTNTKKIVNTDFVYRVSDSLSCDENNSAASAATAHHTLQQQQQQQQHDFDREYREKVEAKLGQLNIVGNNPAGGDIGSADAAGGGGGSGGGSSGGSGGDRLTVVAADGSGGSAIVNRNDGGNGGPGGGLSAIPAPATAAPSPASTPATVSPPTAAPQATTPPATAPPATAPPATAPPATAPPATEAPTTAPPLEAAAPPPTTAPPPPAAAAAAPAAPAPPSPASNSLNIRDRRNCTASSVSVLSDCSSSGGGGVPMIAYSALAAATSNWSRSNLLGRGGFGSVYIGTWKNTEVAVKKIHQVGTVPLECSQTSEELRVLQSYRHDNILQLFGFSAEAGKPACLVYQFMINGSVEDKLQCRRTPRSEASCELNALQLQQQRATPPSLDWSQRLNIALGTAKALQYLHTVKDKPLIHGDIKSANILLDSNFEPKLGDFGLAREGPMSQYTSIQVSRVNGTRPYLPDEYLRNKKLSSKVDCFSYGVVLFELCTGLRAYDEKMAEKYLKDQVLRAPCVEDLVDTKAGPDTARVFPALIALGKECVRKAPKQRPDMASVYASLQKFVRLDQDAANKRLSQGSMASFPSSAHTPASFYPHYDTTMGSVPSTSNSPSPHPSNPFPSIHSPGPTLNASSTQFQPPQGGYHSPQQPGQRLLQHTGGSDLFNRAPYNPQYHPPHHHHHHYQQQQQHHHHQHHLLNHKLPMPAPPPAFHQMAQSPQYQAHPCGQHPGARAYQPAAPQISISPPSKSDVHKMPDSGEPFNMQQQQHQQEMLPDLSSLHTAPKNVATAAKPPSPLHGQYLIHNRATAANNSGHPNNQYYFNNVAHGEYATNQPYNGLGNPQRAMQSPGHPGTALWHLPAQVAVSQQSDRAAVAPPHAQYQQALPEVLPYEGSNCPSMTSASESGVMLPMLTVLGNKTGEDIADTQQGLTTGAACSELVATELTGDDSCSCDEGSSNSSESRRSSVVQEPPLPLVLPMPEQLAQPTVTAGALPAVLPLPDQTVTAKGKTSFFD